jgi:hypothetical protein
MHVIGYFNKPTKDGRTLTGLSVKSEHGPIPVHGPWDPLSTGPVLLGHVTELLVKDNVISVETDCDVSEGKVLSMYLMGDFRLTNEETRALEMWGELVSLVLVDRKDWAWE